MKQVDQQVNFIRAMRWDDPLFYRFDDSVLNHVLKNVVVGAEDILDGIREDLEEAT